MASERIQFGLDGVGVEADFDIDRIRYGGVVHVEDENGPRRFFCASTSRSSPYRIVDVSTRQPEGCRLVTLMRELYLPTDLASRVHAAIGGILPVERIEDRLRATVQEVAFDELHDDAEVFASSIKRIEAALDRLDLVASLERQGGLWLHHRGLVAYLYLTCFDLLGQVSGWLEFPAWLRSKATAGERANAVAGVSATVGDPVAAASALHEWYSARYSVRQGFTRFVREMLPDEVRRQLMNSIVIERYVMPPLAGERDQPTCLDDEKVKVDWLFSLRNKYTHRAAYVPGFREQDLPQDMRDSTLWSMDYKKTSKFKTTYSVWAWPRVLDQAVRVGLAAFVETVSFAC